MLYLFFRRNSIDLYRCRKSRGFPMSLRIHLAYKYYLYLQKCYLCRKLARGNENQLVFVPAIRISSIKNLLSQYILLAKKYIFEYLYPKYLNLVWNQLNLAWSQMQFKSVSWRINWSINLHTYIYLRGRIAYISSDALYKYYLYHRDTVSGA